MSTQTDTIREALMEGSHVARIQALAALSELETQPKEGLSEAKQVNGLTPEEAYKCWGDAEYKWPSLPTPRPPWTEYFLQLLRERAHPLAAHSDVGQLAPTAEKAGDAMAVQLRHLAEEYRNTMSMRGGSSDIHPSHADALTAWFAANSQPSLDIPEAIKAFEFIKEIGERSVDLTRERDMHQMVKWANHGIASLTQQPK